MKRSLLVASLIALLTLAARTQSKAVTSDVRDNAVDKIFAQFARPDTPRCAVAISNKGVIVYKRAYGLADLEHDVPLTPESVF